MFPVPREPAADDERSGIAAWLSEVNFTAKLLLRLRRMLKRSAGNGMSVFEKPGE